MHAIRWTYRIALPVIAGVILIVLPEFRLHPTYVMGTWFADVIIRILITLIVVKGLRGFASTAAVEPHNPHDLSIRLPYDIAIRWGVRGYTLFYIANSIGYCTIIGLIVGWSIAAFLPFLGNHIFTYALIVALVYAFGFWLCFPIGLDWARSVSSSLKSQ